MAFNVRTSGLPALENAATLSTPNVLPAFGAPETVEQLRAKVLNLWDAMGLLITAAQRTDYRFPERLLWETMEALNLFRMTHGISLPEPAGVGHLHADYSQDGIPLRPLVWDGEDWVNYSPDIEPGGVMLDVILAPFLVNQGIVNAGNQTLINALRTELRAGAPSGRDTFAEISALIDGLQAAVAALSFASPAFTGVPTAPTAAPGTNTTQLATTAFAKAVADAAAAAAVASVPAGNLTGTLDPARLPPVAALVDIVASSGIAALTTEQQAEITGGRRVFDAVAGETRRYSGFGAKTDPASYVLLSDASPAIGAIPGLQTALDGKEPLRSGSGLRRGDGSYTAIAEGDVPSLPIAKTAGLQAALDAKQATGAAPATYAQLTAIEASARFDGMLLYVAARSAAGDGGDGLWRFDAASSATANGGTILAPDAGTGRWVRLYNSGAFDVRWFGAKGDGTTNDSPAIQLAINAVRTAGGGTVFFPAGVYRIQTALNATNLKGVILEGVGSAQPTYDFGNVFPRTGTVLLGVTGAGNCVLDMIGGCSCIVRKMAIVTLATAGFGAPESGASQIGILTGTSASGAPDGMGGTAVNLENLAIVMHNGGTGAPTVPIYGLSHNLDEWRQIWTLGNYGIFTAVVNILVVVPQYVAFGAQIGGFNHAMSSINLLGYGTHPVWYGEQSNHVTISQLYIGNIYGGSGASGASYGMYLKDCANYKVDLAVDYFSSAMQITGHTAKLHFHGTTYPNLTPVNSGQPLVAFLNAPTQLKDCVFDISVTRNAGQTFPNNNFEYVGINLPRMSNNSFLISNATSSGAYMDALSASPPPFFNIRFDGPDSASSVGLLVGGAAAAAADYRMFRNGILSGAA